MTEPFFSRWSKRKQALAKGLPGEEPAQAGPSAAAVHEPSATPGHSSPIRGAAADSPNKAEPVDAPSPKVDLPTLDDVQSLTPSSDFQPFMQQGVAADVRNAAVKKLFTDPHFNVMDGLDIYIGDYNTPDPLPAGMLQKMVGAQFLNLFPKTEPIEQKISAEGQSPQSDSMPPRVNPDQSPVPSESLPVVAQSRQLLQPLVLQPDTALLVPAPPEYDDPDLQLQPNHAPASPDPGPSPG